jgi:hypothetical protein
MSTLFSASTQAKNHAFINLNLTQQIAKSPGAKRKHDWLAGFAVGRWKSHPPPRQYVEKFYFQEAFDV